MEEISRALEDALAYRIAKTVRIRDKWLYGYSIAATTLVLFYIVVLKLGVDKVPDWRVVIALPRSPGSLTPLKRSTSRAISEKRTKNSTLAVFPDGLTATWGNGAGCVLRNRAGGPCG